MENQWRGELLTSTDKILGLTRTMNMVAFFLPRRDWFERFKKKVYG